MQLKFDANQPFQTAAIAAVADLFDGQPRIDPLAAFGEAGLAAVPNRLDLTPAALLANLQAVQRGNGLPPDDELRTIAEVAPTVDGDLPVAFPNFTVEMETGTGKTYVYLRTALELHRRYGFRKFIVVVPSVAIREGVLKTLVITRQHFRDLYANVPYRFAVYDSDNLSQIRAFALSDAVELLVMTIDSFNKESNVLRNSTDRLQGETPIHMLQAARPILILDEPQNMESDLSRRSLAALNPLFALRYSATHRNPYNLVYRLTPYDAYRQRLVKRSEVASIVAEQDANQPFLRLDDVTTDRRTITARVALHRLQPNGTIREQVVPVRYRDALEAKANHPAYAGYVVDYIDARDGLVRFTNDVEIRKGEARGANREAIFAEQLRYTIEEHFRKQERLRPAGVKVLSLCFIDRVANYAPPASLLRRLFHAAFDDLKARYPAWRDVDADRVHAGYFAERRRQDQREAIDSVTGRTDADRAAFDLIMKDKERLLSFEEPVAFILSHSALREGWDNPNIFQICTLHQTVSDVRKRQEIGRGVRLAVDQAGDRVPDEAVNVLTVVANESYERYVAQLQTELAAAYPSDQLPPPPENARRRGVAVLRKQYLLDPAFRELWQRISQRTRYAVTIDTERLLADVLPELDAADIPPPRLTITRAEVEVGLDDALQTLETARGTVDVGDLARPPLPDLLTLMADLMMRTSPPVRLTRATLLEIIRRTSNRAAAVANPHDFAATAVRIIKDKLADQLVAGIRYEKLDAWYELRQFSAAIPSWQEYLIPAAHSLYDHVIFESAIERAFVEGLERRQDVKLYVKLPAWFTVPTPVGEYNPDWAIVMEARDAHGKPTGDDLLYLVRETKDTHDLDDLRPDERRKIACGAAHFARALGVPYRVVTTAAELP